MIRSIRRVLSVLISPVGRPIASRHRSALLGTVSFASMGPPLLLWAGGHPSARLAEQLVGVDAIGQPLDGNASTRDGPKQPPGQAAGVRRDENRPGARGLLEPGGDVRCQP